VLYKGSESSHNCGYKYLNTCTHDSVVTRVVAMTKLNWKRLGKSMSEEAIKVGVEALLIALVLGAALNVLAWIVPAAAVGKGFSHILKLKMFA